jgi:hypothetical protein
MIADRREDPGRGLLLARLQAQTNPFTLGGTLTSAQRVARRRQRNFFCTTPWTVANG